MFGEVVTSQGQPQSIFSGILPGSRARMERVVSCVDAIRKENLYCRNRSMCHDHLTAFNSDKTDEVMTDGESFEEQAQGFRLSISNSDCLSLKTTEKRTKEIEKHHHEDVASKTE
ncbi:hypothetical protein AC249_AIPGENE2576 [Exaiptasia diaphana]|nr:hypothetical protein AC249_AIPGENE2576 [Exaiptasia diaphana]